jgi:hypothetical protein
VLRMLFPSTRAAMMVSCFSFGRVFIGLAFLWRRPIFESGWSSISMAFGLLGCQPPLSRVNDSGVFISIYKVVPLAVHFKRKSAYPKNNLLTGVANGNTLSSMKKEQPPRQFAKPFQVRVTPEQHEQFLQSARTSGLTLSAWARARLIQAARKDLKQNG